MVWKPHVTVAAVIERDGEYLMVEEIPEQLAVYNQPAGHLENGERFIDAIIREVNEETAWQFVPEAITGIYRWRKMDADTTFIRVCFSGSVHDHQPLQTLDEGIIATSWLSYAELRELPVSRLRSPMVLRCIDDFRAGYQYPMELIHELEGI